MKQFTITESPYVRRVTFANPPVYLVGADTLAELSGAVEILGHDEHARVVIFDSSVPASPSTTSARRTSYDCSR